MNIISIKKETIVDGEGLRYSIYVSGCSHKCDECHNKDSWDYKAGILLDKELTKEMIQEIKSNNLLDGVTISGGDPLDVKNAKDLLELLKTIKLETNMNIWCYTGFTLEQIKESGTSYQKQCLEYIDILVDGPFMKYLKDPNLKFIGSSNQRIIDLKKAGA